MPTLTWRRRRSPLPEHVIRGAEELLGVAFPADYRTCVRENHGASPEPSGYLIPNKSRPSGNAVGSLLTLDPYAPGNVFAVISGLAYDAQLPSGLVPVADDGGGDLVCLDYRLCGPQGSPSVAYWCHELEGPDGLVPLAPSFTAFLASLLPAGA